MAKKKAVAVATAPAEPSIGQSELVAALVSAINASKPVEKKNAFTRKINTPWTPKDGSAKLKLKRKMYQHGLPLDGDFLTNNQIELLNKLRPGIFLDNYIHVIRRKDRGIDISYNIKTAAQRLKLVNQFGIRNFDELIEKCIYEAANPVKPQFDADGDAF